jgi:hypothetical protein
MNLVTLFVLLKFELSDLWLSQQRPVFNKSLCLDLTLGVTEFSKSEIRFWSHFVVPSKSGLDNLTNPPQRWVR